MKPLQHLLLTTGRAFALLAALMLVIVPALPAHARLHQSDGAAALTHGHPHASGARADVPHQAEGDEAGGLPQQGSDCCFVCHVSVIPMVSAVPLPAATPGRPARSGDRAAPPDALVEALPEPPRPAA